MFVDIESFFFYSFIYTDTNQTVSYFKSYIGHYSAEYD